MTPEDAKIIFSNITEIAVFTDTFAEELELALGSFVEGGQGTDAVGALFLRIVSLPLPQKFIRHPKLILLGTRPGTAIQLLHLATSDGPAALAEPTTNSSITELLDIHPVCFFFSLSCVGSCFPPYQTCPKITKLSSTPDRHH